MRNIRSTSESMVQHISPNSSRVTVRKAHQTALQTAKMASPFRLYDFRHTFGSRTAMAGVDPQRRREARKIELLKCHAHGCNGTPTLE